MTEDIYLSGMAFLFQTLGQQPDKQLISNYWLLLKQMDDEKFQIALTGIMREFERTSANPFPLPSHFLKFSGNNAQGVAIKAISTLKACIRTVGKYESLKFDDSALMLVVDRFGGWSALCNWSDGAWNVNEGRLIEAHKTFYQSGLTFEGDHLPGITEKEAGFFRIYHIESNTARQLSYQRFCGVELLETVELVKIENKETKQLTRG
jgi:hypothetical protein